MVEMYFDESGNTGSIDYRKSKLNYSTQSHFSLGAVIVKNRQEKKRIKDNYFHFRYKFNMSDEVKGNSLLTRENNEKLNYFIDNILNNNNFNLCVYDKKFYLSTLLLNVIFGREYMQGYAEQFYAEATVLASVDDQMFVFYLDFVKNRNVDCAVKFFSYISENVNYPNGFLKLLADDLMSRGDYQRAIDMMEKIDYADNYNNIINLTTLGELILVIKDQNDYKNENCKFYHDRIEQFEEEYIDFYDLGIRIEFVDSKDNLFVQISDNIVSLVNKLIKSTIQIFKEKKEWEKSSEWILETTAKVIDKIGIDKIKMVLPIHDCVLIKCVSIMFNKKYPKDRRGNMSFNIYYAEFQQEFMQSLKGILSDKSCIDILNN